MIVVQRVYSFIMLCFHTSPQVILNLAINQPHLLKTPALFSYKSSSSHRPVGAEQGDTPPFYQQQVGSRKRKEDGRSKEGRAGQKFQRREARVRERVCECNSTVTVGEKSLMFISVWCAKSILIGNSYTLSSYLVVARLHTRLRTGVTMFPLPAGKMISMVCLVLEESV